MTGKGLSAFDDKLAEYKDMVILRQEECVQLAEVIEKKGRELASKDRTLKTALILLGVAIALKSSLELLMLDLNVPPLLMSILSVVFFVVGAAVSLIATFEKANRYEEKAGELRSLATSCKSYDRRFMSDYKKVIDLRKPEITLAKLESMIELQNESLDHIRQRCDFLGIDISKVKTDYRIKA